MKKFNISIISITKNDLQGLKKTTSSIKKLEFDGIIEWLILDGSDENNILQNKKLIRNFKEYKSFYLNYINLKKLSIEGIYNSMDYGLKAAKGESIIFMNGGDQFFNKYSIKNLYGKLKTIKEEKSFVFGQALNYEDKNLNWEFPDNNTTDINKWLRLFEPNHQSMLIKANFAKSQNFADFGEIYADGLWKRNLISNATKYIYIDEKVCIFYLDGISNKKLNLKQLQKELKNKNYKLIRKLIILIKFFTPDFLYTYYPYIQKLKNRIIGFII